MDYVLPQIAEPIYSALIKDLPGVEYETYSRSTEVVDGRTTIVRTPSGTKTRRPLEDEIDLYAFPQTWGSTALGFDGIGGSAMTTAMTVVVVHRRNASVYFGGRHAYTVENFNGQLIEDIAAHSVKDVASSGHYRRDKD